MTAHANRQLSLRDAIDSLLAPDVTGPLDELADALVVASGTIGRLRRGPDAGAPRSAELAALDASFSRVIVLTRELRERLQIRRSRGDYTSVSYVAREVVGRLQGAVPDEVTLLVKCPDGPAIVAADRADLRRVITGLLETGIEASAGNGEIELEVSEVPGSPGDRPRRVVQIEVRCSAGIEEQDARIAAAVRPVVRSIGGALTFRAPLRGGTAIAVRLPSAC